MAETLKFVARADLLVREPGSVAVAGAPPRFANRETRKLPSGEWGYPALAEPFTCAANSEDAHRCAILARRDAALWPFDQTTAAACGLPFVPVELVDGEWVPAKSKKSAPLRAVVQAEAS
jgi:hypothetical protein